MGKRRPGPNLTNKNNAKQELKVARDDEEATAIRWKKFYAVRSCDSLKAPALFFNYDDCRVYFEDERSEDFVLDFEEFALITDAIRYLLDCEGGEEDVPAEKLSGPKTSKTAKDSHKKPGPQTQVRSCRKDSPKSKKKGRNCTRDDVNRDNGECMGEEKQVQRRRSPRKTAPIAVPPLIDSERKNEDEGAQPKGGRKKDPNRGRKIQTNSQTGEEEAKEEEDETPSTKRKRRKLCVTDSNHDEDRGGEEKILEKKNDPWVESFEANFKLLEQFKGCFGTCEVPIGPKVVSLLEKQHSEFVGLSEWVIETRKKVKALQLEESPDAERQQLVDRLLELGFVQPKRGRNTVTDLLQWEDSFHEQFEQLRKYNERFGTTNVSCSDLGGREADAEVAAIDGDMAGEDELDKNKSDTKSDKDKDLRRWVVTTRRIIKRHESSSAQNPALEIKIQKLLDLGFVVEEPALPSQKTFRGKTEEERWENMFQCLQAYQAENGHCDVPQQPPSSLHRWIAKQKRAYSTFKEGKPASITPEQVARLTALGLNLQGKTCFTWEERAYQWLAFKTKNGRDPKWFSENGLRQWVSAQRNKYALKLEGKQTNLTQEQIDTLEQWGFDWQAGRVKKKRPPRSQLKSWDERYEDLIQYQQEHGTTNVPQFYPGLGFWVHTQRIHYQRYLKGQKSGLTREKIEKLKAIDFAFKARQSGSARGKEQQLGGVDSNSGGTKGRGGGRATRTAEATADETAAATVTAAAVSAVARPTNTAETPVDREALPDEEIYQQQAVIPPPHLPPGALPTTLQVPHAEQQPQPQQLLPTEEEQLIRDTIAAQARGGGGLSGLGGAGLVMYHHRPTTATAAFNNQATAAAFSSQASSAFNSQTAAAAAFNNQTAAVFNNQATAAFNNQTAATAFNNQAAAAATAAAAAAHNTQHPPNNLTLWDRYSATGIL